MSEDSYSWFHGIFYPNRSGDNGYTNLSRSPPMGRRDFALLASRNTMSYMSYSKAQMT